jgi:hypothetical protein
MLSFNSNEYTAYCVDRGTYGACALTNLKQKAHARDARLWGEIPVRLSQKSEKKNPDGFLSNFW